MQRFQTLRFLCPLTVCIAQQTGSAGMEQCSTNPRLAPLAVDKDGRYLDIYANSCSLLFDPRENLIGRTVQEMLPAAAARAAKEALDAAFQTGSDYGRSIQLPVQKVLRAMAASSGLPRDWRRARIWPQLHPAGLLERRSSCCAVSMPGCGCWL